MKKIYAHMTRDDLEDAYAQCSRTNEEYSASLTTAEARIVTLEESLHYCNGTADLAIQHRDDAEAENERLSKLADVSIEANVEADGLRSALEQLQHEILSAHPMGADDGADPLEVIKVLGQEWQREMMRGPDTLIKFMDGDTEREIVWEDCEEWAGYTISENDEPFSDVEAELERAVADGVLMKAQMQSAAQYAVGVAAERDMAMDDGAALRGALEKLAWETVADKGGSEASECRLCGGVLNHVPDCILATDHPGAGVHAMVEAAEEYVSVKRVLVTGPKVNSAFARLCDALDGDVTATCEHDWIDARNSVVKDGEWCRKCNVIRSGNEATAAMDKEGVGDV